MVVVVLMVVIRLGNDINMMVVVAMVMVMVLHESVVK